MSSEYAQSYMDKLKVRNTPAALRQQETPPVPMVQISAEDWNRLTRLVQHLEALSDDLTAQKADMTRSTEMYTAQMAKAAQEQTAATKEAIRKISTEAAEQVGRASEKASRVIWRQTVRDEAIWWLRLALTAIPVILVLLLWARVGLPI